MLTMTEKGNLETVRDALSGITGVKIEAPSPQGPPWYLVMIRNAREGDAVDSYRRSNIRAYWPTYEELRPTRHKAKGHPICRKRRMSIIPGYIFPEAVEGALDLDGIIGAIDYVRKFSGDPLRISDEDIKIIRHIETGLNTPKPESTEHTFKVGEKVRFSDDLIGRWPPGKIIKLAANGRISVEVSLMGRKLPITVFPHQIERTQAQSSAKRLPA